MPPFSPSKALTISRFIITMSEGMSGTAHLYLFSGGKSAFGEESQLMIDSKGKVAHTISSQVFCVVWRFVWHGHLCKPKYLACV